MLRTSVAAAAVLCFAGCSQTASSQTDSMASEPGAAGSGALSAAAKGTKISGTGYTYRVPRGWGRSPRKIPGFDPDSFVVNLKDKDRFADNLNVLLAPGGVMTPQQIEDVVPDNLAAQGIKDVTVNDRVSVAGTESVHLTGVASANGTAYTVEQFYTRDDGSALVLTFSFSRSVEAGDRARVTDPVLASWAWTD